MYELDLIRVDKKLKTKLILEYPLLKSPLAQTLPSASKKTHFCIAYSIKLSWLWKETVLMNFYHKTKPMSWNKLKRTTYPLAIEKNFRVFATFIIMFPCWLVLRWSLLSSVQSDTKLIQSKQSI